MRFASSAMRIAAVLVVAAGAAGTFGVLNVSQIPGMETVALPPLAIIVAGALIVAFAVMFALILWGFADGLVLLADLDDAQREVQRQLADLVLAQRTARGPFHAEAVEARRASEVPAIR